MKTDHGCAMAGANTSEAAPAATNLRRVSLSAMRSSRFETLFGGSLMQKPMMGKAAPGRVMWAIAAGFPADRHRAGLATAREKSTKHS